MFSSNAPLLDDLITFRTLDDVALSQNPLRLFFFQTIEHRKTFLHEITQRILDFMQIAIWLLLGVSLITFSALGDETVDTVRDTRIRTPIDGHECTGRTNPAQVLDVFHYGKRSESGTQLRNC